MKKKAVILAAILSVIAIICGLCYMPGIKLQSEAVTLDASLTNNEFYLSEETYEEEMEQIVLPYLAQYEKIGSFVTPDMTTISYRTYLPENSKQAVVISHGFTESSERFEEVIYYFLLNEYAVYIMDHRGHGYSDRAVDDLCMVYVGDFEDYVEDFAQFVREIVMADTMDMPRHLYAHSMGGAIGTRVLEKYPDYFDKAVLTTPMMSINPGIPNRIASLVASAATSLGFGDHYVIGHGSFNGEDDASVYAISSQARFEYWIQKQRDNKSLQTSGASYSWLNQGFKGTKELLKEENLSNISIPVLVFQAGADSLVRPDGHYAFVNSVDSATLVIVPDEKHSLYASGNSVLIPYFNTVFAFFAS